MALRLKLKWRVGQGVRSRVRKGVWGLRSMYLLCPCLPILLLCQLVETVQSSSASEWIYTWRDNLSTRTCMHLTLTYWHLLHDLVDLSWPLSWWSLGDILHYCASSTIYFLKRKTTPIYEIKFSICGFFGNWFVIIYKYKNHRSRYTTESSENNSLDN